MNRERGITLIELVIVISIIITLLVAIGVSFEGWMAKYRIESQIKEIYSDLMLARARAMQMNRVHFVRLLNNTSYTIYEDTNPLPDGDGVLQLTGTTDTQLPTFPKTVRFDINWNNSAITAPINLEFNTRGYANVLGTISVYVDRDGDGKKDFVPDYDCIEISATRINIGQIDDKKTPSRSDDECIQK